MSDLTIPGVTSKFNTEKIIEGLMKVERIPLERLEEKNELSKKQKQTWLDLNRKLTTLRDSSRKLYSFQNPFEDKIAFSSDETLLTASAERNAAVEKREIKIVATAAADRFVSLPIPKKEKVEPGSYIFLVGEKKIELNFRGGTVREFSDFINKNSQDQIKSATINFDSDNLYFVIESKITGTENKLTFSGKASDFALKTGIMEKSQSSARDIIPAETINRWNAPLDEAGYLAEGNSVTLKPGKELGIAIKPPAAPDKEMILEFDITLKKLSEEEAAAAPKPNSGPVLPSPGILQFEDITISNNPFDLSLSEKAPPLPQEEITDMSVYFLGIGGTITRGSDIIDTEEIQKIKIPLADLNGSLSSLNLRNRNTHRELSVSNIRIYNPQERGELVPANPASKAADAELEIDGIKITRSSNTIDDLIPGVTLNLKAPGERKTEIEIKPDTENIKNSIIELVGYYNNLMAEVQILARNNEDIINEIEYFSDEERKSAKERMGVLQGEISLTQLRDRLQRIVTNAYPWNDDNRMTMLAQLGISTNTGAPGSRGASKLRGYLEIDEQKLDTEIESNGAALKNLFGYDTDLDLLTDSGLAYELDTYLKAYNETGGIISLKTGTIDRSISRTETEITNYNKKLVKLEQDLKRKYGMMEGALQDLEKTSASIQNMNTNNSR
ncbi:MAG: flagellar filament capping protein FliD [Spirochaetia bacterium]|jgi:flagellar hook-associated protein 2|nr:flagellar filament capping protein FliD [Spirochaetia bacterium]